MSGLVESDRSQRYLPDDWALPMLNSLNRPFFTSGRLMLQRCMTCDQVQHPPLDVCHFCQGLDLHYEPADGRGRISSFTIVHRAADTRLDSIVPYNVVVVELDDYPGVMIVGNVCNCPEDQLSIGMPVRCTFAEVHDNETGDVLLLPQWERE